MTTVTLQVPEDILGQQGRSLHELGRELRLAAAIHWYQQRRLSQERAAEFAGLDRTDFLLEIARRGVEVFEVDFDDLDRELERG